MLRLVLPKGSLEKPTLELFEAADLRVERSSTVDYRATVDDPRIEDVRILRPQEIPVYVAEGLFDLGIAGRDWVEETASDVEILGELQYSKATSRPFRIVLAVPQDSPIESAAGIQQVQLTTGVPVAFGVLTTEDRDQALARSEGPGGHNVGEDAAVVAVEMARLAARHRPS